MVEEVVNASELKLNYVHEGRSILINGDFYLVIFSIGFLLWRRLEGFSLVRRIGTPVIFAVSLIIPWIICLVLPV